ncbi:PhnD/SsuA/transferrin family substrate-binding protein, partial [Roseateles sp.]|uniref:PhnD/SsuA/transferrin family substrate-binding protein n=1 Tax=Roseateles sp. TaxID=1971397 RepID=UPI0039E03292
MSSIHRRRLNQAFVAASLALMGVGAQAQAQTQTQTQTQTPVLRVTAIPDESPTELARKAAPLMRYLEAQLGMRVEFTPVTDYAAAVETLVNKKI